MGCGGRGGEGGELQWWVTPQNYIKVQNCIDVLRHPNYGTSTSTYVRTHIQYMCM